MPRFTCELILETSRGEITIHHRQDFRARPATTHIIIRTENGLRDATFVSATLTDDAGSITVTFFFIDGESPDAPHVAVTCSVEQNLAHIGEWHAEGVTVDDFVTATKQLTQMSPADIKRLHLVAFED